MQRAKKGIRKMSVTTAVKKTIEAQSNMVRASAEVVNGRFMGARLTLETRNSYGTNTLRVRNTRHLMDIIQATQELLQALAKEKA